MGRGAARVWSCGPKTAAPSWTTPADRRRSEQGSHLFAVQAIDDDRGAWTVGEWGTRHLHRRRRQDLAGLFPSPMDPETHPAVRLALGGRTRSGCGGGEKVFEDVGLNDVYCRPVRKP